MLKVLKLLLFITIIGAPETIRTFDLCLRRAALYPAELRARGRAIMTYVLSLWQMINPGHTILPERPVYKVWGRECYLLNFINDR